MKNTHMIRLLALLLAASIMMTLAGCGANTVPTPSEDDVPASSQEVTPAPDETPTPSDEQTTPAPDATEPPEETPPEESAAPTEQPTEPTPPPVVVPTEPERDENGLTEQQRNSYSMLYHLAITAENIRISKDNRLILDDIYNSLDNDINPGAIDEITQEHLTDLRKDIKDFRNIAVKRERLQYIYNQGKAATMRSAVPNPLAILAMTNSFDWRNLVTSTVYTVVDSYNNYKKANETVDQNFLMSGWELDDDETATMERSREEAFNYMVDIVQEYALDGKLTLNKEEITEFAEICEIEFVQEKIRRLESEEETYKLLGNYWLELADCYYQKEQYEKCLECVDKYNTLSTSIYLKDYNYVQILPKAIVAAQETYTGNEYVSHIQTFAKAIKDNTKTKEWSTRYFAAQVYLDLYARTTERKYLEEAYNIAYDNMTILLPDQRKLNETYLNDLEELTVQEPDYRFMTETEKKDAEKEYEAEQKRVKNYNKELKEARKTELPPLYEPLILNCDLLFALADEMGISDKEKAEIEEILRPDNGKHVFLSKPINDLYSFKTATTDYSIEFTKDKIVIPVDLLTAGAKVVVSVSDSGKATTFDDCIIDKVERKGESLNTFKATFTSKLMKDYEWTEDSKVTVKIISGEEYNPLVFKFKIVEFKDNWLIADKVVFAEE